MKKIMALGMALAFAGNASKALAATGSSNVTVTIAVIDKLSVTNGGTITLDNSQADPTTGILGPVSDATARLSYMHNKTSTMKLTAQAAITAPPTNDITLTVSVTGGAGQKTLDSAGVLQSAQDVYTTIPAGFINSTVVTYSAQATAAGTPVGSNTNFNYTITYTSTAG